MTKIRDLPSKERWPTLYRWVRNSFKISAVVTAVFGIPWIVLAFGFQGLPTSSTTKTVVENGIQTTTTTTVTNALASQLIGIVMWPAIVAGVYLLYGGILIGPRLLSLGDEEVEQKE